MIAILVGAAMLGLIIAMMEEGEFPGWGKMILCVLAATVPAVILQKAMDPGLWFVGLAVGALSGAVAISALCGMSVKRAGIAASIYFGVQIILSLVLQAMMA